MPEPVLLVDVEPVPVDVDEEPTEEPVPVADCDEMPPDVEFEVDEVDPVRPEEVLELSSPIDLHIGMSFAQEAR